MTSKYRDRSLLLNTVSLVLLFLLSSEYCCAIENISQSQTLSQEKTLVSPGQIFELGFFAPNNSGINRYVGIWYKNISPQTIVWVLNRERPVGDADSSASLRISEDGNLELVDGNNETVWSTSLHVRSKRSVATLLDDGNLVLKDVETDKTLWQSFDRLGDTLLPGSVIGFDGKTEKNDVLTSWKSDSDPTLGNFSVEVSTKVMPAQVFVWNGTRAHYRSGPWDVIKSYQNPFDLIEIAGQRTAHLHLNPDKVSSTYTKLFISPKGNLKITVKEEGLDWRTIWESRKSSCDVYGFCGNFGVCEASESPVCRCFKGYAPKSDLEWKEQNWSRGCFRRAPLLCERNYSRGKSDGFIELTSTKLPDSYQYLTLPRNATDCQKSCLESCSCSACAYVSRVGCFVWSESMVDVQKFSSVGQSLFLRLAHRELVRGKSNKNAVTISLATISCVVSLLCVFPVIYLGRRDTYQKKSKVQPNTEKTEIVERSSTFTKLNYHKTEFPIFGYESLLIATDNFSFNKNLGKLKDGTEIAVKRLSSNSGQGAKEFQNEMVLVSKLQHRNLVRLLGFCTENDEKLLVYEYMANKSLDSFIFDSQRSAKLDWTMRFNIIICIARGLVYLHRDSFLRVIHRDLKASNVLLDDKMNPKISDFGLAKIFEETFDVANTQRVVGTLGYMSPEYAMGGIFSEKSDVYSFGILMLEILSGRKNTNFKFYEKHFSLVGFAWELWSEGRDVEMVDKALKKGYSSEEAMRCVHVGLLCVQDQAADRPTMPGIVSMLMNESDRPRPKEPLFTFERQKPQTRQHNDTEGSVNEVTVSILDGR